MIENIQEFFNTEAYAIIGASVSREKFGNKVLRCLLSRYKKVYPVHLKEAEIEGILCYQSIEQLPDNVKSLSVITPPGITETIVEAAHKKGIENIWMQPGAESATAIQKCHDYNLNVIANGPCILVELDWFKHQES